MGIGSWHKDCNFILNIFENMRILLVLIFVAQAFVSFSQPGVARELVVKGKNYYEHNVEAGNTLWGLQRMYGIDAETIVAENPELKDGIKVGQKLLIPRITSAPIEADVISEYKVKNSETLYGLSKKFNTTVDRLIELNPELSEGLKKGQSIKVPGEYKDEIQTTETEIKNVEEEEEVIPNPFIIETEQTDGTKETVKITYSDSTIRHSVLAHETMYSISKRFMVSMDEIMKKNGLTSSSVKEEQILIIPVKSERIQLVEFKKVPDHIANMGKEITDMAKKDEYTIALFLPFFLEYGPGYSEYVANLSAQFYMGAMLAVDTLEAKGLNAKIHVFDTRNDSITIAKLLQNSIFDKVDLVIGPLLGDKVNQVATFCKSKDIRMVCPVTSDSDVLEGNPYFFSAVPSNITLMKGLAKYMVSNYSKDNIVLIKPTDKKSLPMYEAFRKTFNETPFNGTRPHLVEATIESFSTYIKRGVNTRFVVPSIDKSTAMKFMNNLNRSAFRSKADDLFVYGTKEWVNFTDINNVYKNKYNFHFPSPNHLDYFEDNVVALNRVYRSKYKTDISKMAVQGYDVLLYFSSNFFLNGKKTNLIMNDFNMKSISLGDGQENSNVFIIEQENFNLLKVGIFH